MKPYSVLAVVLLLVVAVSANAQWQFVKAFPDTSFKLPSGVNNGIAVDPAGKVWIQSFSGSNDSLAPGVKTGCIYVFNPDGTPTAFSPIKVLSGVDQNGAAVTDTLNGSGYGMRVNPANGNILSVKWSYRVWEIDYNTGAGIRRIQHPIPGYTSSLASVAADSLGEIFVGPVLPGAGVAILNPDFTAAGSVVASVGGYGRDILVSKNGNDVYVPRFDMRKVYVYHSDNGSLGPYALSDSILTQLVVETMAWHPKTGYLWAGSGNTVSGLPDTGYTPYAWYAYNLNTRSIVDSIVWNGPIDVDPRPRGIAFSPAGDTAYVAEFNASTIPCVQMFRRVPTSVELVNNLVPDGYSLSQNYPNPFNPTTEIEFSIPTAGFTTLKVYDLLGKEAATLVNEQLNPGTFKARLDGSRLASGTYIYRLTSGSAQISRKMLLLK
ncbi:MAG: T9SS type A sorting domain-containing protein [Bacteroidota bacterium]